MPELLLSTFRCLEQNQIQYCLIRDTDRIERLGELDEIDLLVNDNQLTQVRKQLAELGFVRLPNWGHAPHHFFVAYDEAADHWLKLDIVTSIAFGHPYHTMITDLAIDCLESRQRCGSTFVPAPECELVMLLLHCTLDKGSFAPQRRQRLQSLRYEIRDESYLTTLLQRYWLPNVTWTQLATQIDNENWDKLLLTRSDVTQYLMGRQRISVSTRRMQQRIQRKFNSWVKRRRPNALTVAVMAPDGAGKSTLVAGIRESFYFPTHTIYMGLYQKGGESATPAPVRGAGFVRFAVTQWQRYLKARYHQAQRKLVIFDRYTYDALLSSHPGLTYPQRLRRWLLAHVCPAPDLVIVLDAPGETLFARKGEHPLAKLEKQRQFYLKLQSRIQQVIVVDATLDTDQVRRRVIAQIWQGYLRRQMGLKPHVAIQRASFDLCGQEQ